MENIIHTEIFVEATETQARKTLAELAELELAMVGGGIGDVQI